MKKNMVLALIGLLCLQATIVKIIADQKDVSQAHAANATSWKNVPGGLQFIQTLINERAKTKSATTAEETVLQKSVDGDNSAFVKMFIQRGDDIQVKDSAGQSLIHLTLTNDDTKVLKQLINAGVDINAGDSYGITPLHLYLNLFNSTARPEKKKFAQDAIALLLNAGANIHATGKIGVSPWEMVNWKKNGLNIFPTDLITLFINQISPQEALYAGKGAKEREEIIQNKLALAKAYLPLLSPRKDALRAEIEKNLTNALTKN